MSKPIYILVGGSGSSDPAEGPFYPAAGQRDVSIPSLKGFAFWIERQGEGPVLYSNYSALSAGGFRYFENLTEGDEFWLHIAGLNYANDTTGNYTNGFDFNKVMTALFGRIGWAQTANSPTLNSTNLQSRSGRYFNDGSFHQIISLNTLKALMETPSATDVQFNAFLVAQQRAVILRCLQGVFDDVEFISQGLAYSRCAYGTNDNVLPNTGKFVGFTIALPPSVDIAVQIDSVALYFDSDVTFNLYVFNDAKQSPVYVKNVTAQANNQTVVDLSDVVLNYIGGANHGGVFHFGYFQDDLGSAQAIRESAIEWNCDNVYRIEGLEAIALPDSKISNANIGYTRNSYGLNPHISAFRDHTFRITKKPSLFDNLIGLQMAAQTVELALFSQRSNAGQRGAVEAVDKVQLSMELMGTAPISESPETTGLRKQIREELDRVSDAFENEKKSRIVNLSC